METAHPVRALDDAEMEGKEKRALLKFVWVTLRG